MNSRSLALATVSTFFISLFCAYVLPHLAHAQPAGVPVVAAPPPSAPAPATTPTPPASKGEDSAHPSQVPMGGAAPAQPAAKGASDDDSKVYPGFYFGLGFAGMVTAGSGNDIAPGLDIIFQGQSGHWAYGGMIRGYLSPQLHAGLSNVGLNGKFFILDGNYSPYVGAGLGMYAIATRVQPNENITDGYGNWGVGSLFEVGFEAFRYSSVRLGVFGRIDVPFFKLEQVDLTVNSTDSVIPVSAGLYFLF